MRRVVITGVGVVSPLGLSSKSFWENLISGTPGVKRISSFDPSGFACQIGGEVPPYKVGDYVPKNYRKATKVMARDIELAVVAADDAFKDAGLKSKAYTETPEIVAERFGCNIGAGLISADLNELTQAMAAAKDEAGGFDLKLWGNTGMNQLTPLWLLKYLPNMLACHVTIIHGLKGPSNTITCADASSHLAIGEAFRTIQRGAADAAICGGAECKLVPMGQTRQQLLKRLTETGNDNPATAVRPFDSAASGSAIGEGGGLFILEEYEAAKKRGAKIYAEVAGFGASQDSYSVTTPDPTGHSYAKAITKALADARANPDDIDLLVPHGLGIPAFDRSELTGLRTALGPALKKIALTPIKAQTGSLAAGSGQDAAAAVLALHHKKAPGAINSQNPIDQDLNLSKETRDLDAKLTVSTVYALGGQNAALVFRRV
jgi:3-oxoacyl-[acyl-carrier-protein] synthase II